MIQKSTIRIKFPGLLRAIKIALRMKWNRVMQISLIRSGL